MGRIIVVTHGFPNNIKPNEWPFLKELTDNWCCSGVNVMVIKPVTLPDYFKLKHRGKSTEGYASFPLYFDYSFLRAFRFAPFIRKLHIRIADKSFQRAVERKVRIQHDDILYSHFLDSGFCVAALSEKYSVPSYCAVGESTLWTLEFKNMEVVRMRMQNISGFIAVSSRNKKMLIENKLASADKIKVFPNGVDFGKIFPLNKTKCRETLNINQDDVVGVFVGHFIERKGPLRVEDASMGITGLKMMYIGSGNQVPKGDNIIFKGTVPHDTIAKYLSAADFFVLPTLAEGCCNAIVEAMACGLPIISSDCDFNDDILDENCSIRINPMNIQQIHEAMTRLVIHKELRKKMSEAALNKAHGLSLNERANNILRYIEDE